MEKIIIHDLIADVIEDYTDQIGKPQNQRIMFESDREDFVVEADRERITQVICNLLNNAVKFSGETKSGEDRAITISSNRLKQEQRDYVTISIRDRGTGIDPEIFPQLFSRFTSRSFSGTGLGLFISKSIVEAHGGKIWAENNADGKGSTFTFTLPIASE
jgi:signal transduction histidine kinase